MGGQARVAAPEGGGTNAESEPVTDGTLLGGRVLYRQFRDGYRTGI